jgi:hypothetical protein
MHYADAIIATSQLVLKQLLDLDLGLAIGYLPLCLLSGRLFAACCLL